jgi:hypothetical protein
MHTRDGVHPDEPIQALAAQITIVNVVRFMGADNNPPCLPIAPYGTTRVSAGLFILGGVVDRAVFINYRGEDSRSYGALLYTELTRHFGDRHVFLDAESIPAGADFVRELLGRVRSARVVLAVIGPSWLTATGPSGRRRIDDPADWIRRELAEAFTAGVRVIPILTEQVKIPAEAELPADIAALSRCQYRRLRHHDPTADLARIVTDLASLDPTLAAAARSRDKTPRQLPAAPGMFTGRGSELATLTDATTTEADAGATVVISAIGGAGGIGKPEPGL